MSNKIIDSLVVKESIDCKMIIRVLSLVFLFIVRLRFPSHKSIANVIRSRYNDEIVKQIWRFEKLDFKIGKNEADLDFFTVLSTKESNTKAS